MPDNELEAAKQKYMGKLVRGVKRGGGFTNEAVGIVTDVYRGHYATREIFLELHTDIRISTRQRTITIFGEG